MYVRDQKPGCLLRRSPGVVGRLYDYRGRKTVAFVGSNGAGKSTLMQAITGLIKPSAGTIMLDGTRIDKLPPHRIVESGVCMVPEGRRLFPQMTILENLEVGASVKAARKEET